MHFFFNFDLLKASNNGEVGEIPDSEQASELDKLKKANAEQEAKSEARRKQFQGQDSVVAESLQD